MTIKERSWWIEVPITVTTTPTLPEQALTAPKWLRSLDPPRFVPIRREDHTAVRVRYRSHRILVDISHHGPAYLGEDFPMEINVTNQDDKELDIVVDVLLQPTEIDEAGKSTLLFSQYCSMVRLTADVVNYIAMDDQRSTSLIKAVACGTLAPGVSVLKKLYLTNAGVPGERIVDISVQSQARTPSSSSCSSSPSSAPTSAPTSPSPSSPSSLIPAEPASPNAPPMLDRTETLRTLSISAIEPLKIAHSTVYRRPTRAQPGLADLRTFEAGTRDEAAALEAFVTSTLTIAASAGIVIESVVLKRNEQDKNQATVVDCSIDKDDLSGGACSV